MHDVVRDFALIIASKYNHKFMVKASIGQWKWPNRDTFDDFTCISFMKNNIGGLLDGLECPNLQMLFLQGNNDLVVPNNFFHQMIYLKVLDFNQTKLLSVPESLSFLSSLRTLYLSGCTLGDLSVVEKLSKLEILNLCNSSIRRSPYPLSS